GRLRRQPGHVQRDRAGPQGPQLRPGDRQGAGRGEPAAGGRRPARPVRAGHRESRPGGTGRPAQRVRRGPGAGADERDQGADRQPGRRLRRRRRRGRPRRPPRRGPAGQEHEQADRRPEAQRRPRESAGCGERGRQQRVQPGRSERGAGVQKGV
ncbi:MAG: hypothetical protein AVDCRST_MAG64-575, partial [uncultured Phycisphaerae bacterium]